MLPGVDTKVLQDYYSNGNLGGLGEILSIFSGGAFSNASIMALGIMPYISASIIMQLLGMALPMVQKLREEGQSGQNKINNYTRILTIVICAIQGPSYISMYVGSAPGAIVDGSPLWWIQAVTLLVAGSFFAMWLGERITEKGLGNGISILITVGILAGLPMSFIKEWVDTSATGNYLAIVIEIVVFFAVILTTVLIVQGVRRVPIQYAKKIAGNRAVGEQGTREYLPIKLNAAGVMPIIFAQAIMTVPLALIGQSSEVSWMTKLGLNDMFGFGYNLVMFILIIVFTYLYTAITISPKRIAEDMRRNGGFVPGIKPGTDTANHIDGLLSRITLPGSISLAIIAILPAFAKMAGVGDSFAMFFGGTSLLIMVGVVLDTLQQLEQYLLNRKYDGLMEGGKIRGRRSSDEMSGLV
jgi:preprotein translocase subunit SecY